MDLYRWENSGRHKPCRSRACRRAHYKDGLPKRYMTMLTVTPPRKGYVNNVWLCDTCKALDIIRGL